MIKMYADKSIYLLNFIDFYVHPHNRLIYTEVYISIKIYVQGNWGKPGSRDRELGEARESGQGTGGSQGGEI